MKAVIAVLDYLMGGLFCFAAAAYAVYLPDVLSTVRKEDPDGTLSSILLLPACVLIAIAGLLGGRALGDRSSTRLKTFARVVLIAALMVAMPMLVAHVISLHGHVPAPEAALIIIPAVTLCATLGMI